MIGMGKGYIRSLDVYGKRSKEEAVRRKLEREREVSEERVLGYELYEEQRKWVEFAFSRDLELSSKDVEVKNIQGARDYGKTEAVVKYGVIKYLKEKPKGTFIIVTREYSRAKDILYAISISMKEIGFRGEFKGESIRLEGNKRKEASISIATNKAGSIRGKHVDYMICDDLVIASDENSEVERERVIKFYQECFNVAKNIVILGQPVHEKDLYAELKKQGIKSIYSFYGSIPERDKDIEELRRGGVREREIQKNYYGELVPDGKYPFGKVKVEEFRFRSNTFGVIDPAFEGEDYIGVAIGIEKKERIYIVTYKIEGGLYDEGMKERIIRILEENKVMKCYVESVDNGGVYEALRGMESDVYFVKFKPRGNKEARIKSLIGGNIERISISSYGDFIEITDYSEEKKSKDVADAMASLINFLTYNKLEFKVG